MIITNCGYCGIEINAENSKTGDGCNLCHDCYLDYYFKRLKPNE